MEDVPLGSDEDETRNGREKSPTEEGNSLGLCFRKKLARSFNNH